MPAKQPRQLRASRPDGDVQGRLGVLEPLQAEDVDGRPDGVDRGRHVEEEADELGLALLHGVVEDRVRAVGEGGAGNGELVANFSWVVAQQPSLL